jgi:hypothetical protein
LAMAASAEAMRLSIYCSQEDPEATMVARGESLLQDEWLAKGGLATHPKKRVAPG